jgi:hypothetical protein
MLARYNLRGQEALDESGAFLFWNELFILERAFYFGASKEVTLRSMITTGV